MNSTEKTSVLRLTGPKFIALHPATSCRIARLRTITGTNSPLSVCRIALDIYEKLAKIYANDSGLYIKRGGSEESVLFRVHRDKDDASENGCILYVKLEDLDLRRIAGIQANIKPRDDEITVMEDALHIVEELVREYCSGAVFSSKDPLCDWLTPFTIRTSLLTFLGA